MGVELGKVLAKNILAQLGKPEEVQGHDSSVGDYPCENGLDPHTWHASYRQLASFTTTRGTGRNK
jgi:hypothetical protein